MGWSKLTCIAAFALGAFVLAVASASAGESGPHPLSVGDPTLFYSRDFGPREYSHHVPIPVDAPNGVLFRVSNAVGDAYTCPRAGDQQWFYDESAYRAGDDVDLWGFTVTNPIEVGFTVGLALPPQPPFGFSGAASSVDTCAGSGVAFVAPSDNTYQLNFGITSGSYAFTVRSTGVTETVTASVSREVFLHAGLQVINIAPSDEGASWSITGDDTPPALLYPHQDRLAATPRTSTGFSVAFTESGRATASVLRKGQVVRTLVTNQSAPTGGYRFSWDGTLDTGEPAPLGTYTVRVTQSDWKGRTVSHDFSYQLHAPTYLIQGDTKVGGLAIGRTTVAAAKARFGPPTSLRQDRGGGCSTTWRRLGLTLVFLDLSGSPRQGCQKGGLVGATITSRTAWHTVLGLRVGDTQARIKTLYPRATFRRYPTGYWLTTRRSCAEIGGYKYPGLLARMHGGKVSALDVSVGICE